MPVNHETTLNVVCDNPACPGNDLDAAKLDGWLVISSEVYGEPTNDQTVFCSAACLSAFTGAVGKGKQEWPRSAALAPPSMIGDEEP